MTDIDVTAILDEDCSVLSASQSELGRDAGQITWRNCLELAERHPLATNANRAAIRSHFREYGAWEREEIEAWTDSELSALVWQEAANAVRMQGTSDDSGRLCVNDDGTAYFYLGC